MGALPFDFGNKNEDHDDDDDDVVRAVRPPALNLYIAIAGLLCMIAPALLAVFDALPSWSSPGMGLVFAVTLLVWISYVSAFWVQQTDEHSIHFVCTHPRNLSVFDTYDYYDNSVRTLYFTRVSFGFVLIPERVFIARRYKAYGFSKIPFKTRLSETGQVVRGVFHLRKIEHAIVYWANHNLFGREQLDVAQLSDHLCQMVCDEYEPKPDSDGAVVQKVTKKLGLCGYVLLSEKF